MNRFGTGSDRIPRPAATKQAVLTVVGITLLSALLSWCPLPAAAQGKGPLDDAIDNHLRGNFDTAVELYSQAIKNNPKDAAAFNGRGLAYLGKMDMDKAEKDFTEAIKQSPNFSDAYNNRGEVYRARKKYPEAIKDYEAAIKLEKNFAEAHYNMGLVLDEQGKKKGAMDAFMKYLENAPQTAQDRKKVQEKVQELNKLAAMGESAAPSAKPGERAGQKPAPSAGKPGEPAKVQPQASAQQPRPGQTAPAKPVMPKKAETEELIPGLPPEVGSALQTALLLGPIVSLAINIAFYLFFAIMLFLIAGKTNTANAWLAFVPIGNLVLMVIIAGLPIWWVGLFFAPVLLIVVPLLAVVDPTGGIIPMVLAVIIGLVPLAAFFFVCKGIADAREKGLLWAILSFIPCTSPIGFGYLGLSK
ncbi:MAG: tetratricopeptide repeat protein [Pseudomonadota bacterium]